MNTINVAELITIRLMSSSFEVISEERIFEGGNLNVQCNFTLVEFDGSNSEPEEKEPLQGECEVVVEAADLEDETKNLFRYDAKYIALFNVSDEESFYAQKEKERADYCLGKIYPLIREDLMSCFDRADLRQIYLPHHFSTAG
ncbi:hypothetical protein R7R52_04510 [Vibrio sp. 665]|uniref:hypothetical protein n=1 Tax=Vibrio TaxID=662 RepID=UPI00215DEC00|nr:MULTISPECIES: hypothetical protein [Vibrio]MCS0251329.1 hypothetical protein [Vibrio alginolyticus]MDW2031244.1 hypothetical protein [Vibrio sp. 665]